MNQWEMLNTANNGRNEKDEYATARVALFTSAIGAAVAFDTVGSIVVRQACIAPIQRRGKSRDVAVALPIT